MTHRPPPKKPPLPSLCQHRLPSPMSPLSLTFSHILRRCAGDSVRKFQFGFGSFM